jgi:hypothetical protein
MPDILTPIPTFEELAASTEQHSRRIMVTVDGENVMNFTRLSPEILEAALKARGFEFEDICEVPEEDMQYYLYEPNWLTDDSERFALKLAANVEA